MSRKKADLKNNVFAILDPLREYAEMMSVQDVAEFAGISEQSAMKFVQEHGGVIVVKGKIRNVWRIHKEYVRQAFNVPKVIA